VRFGFLGLAVFLFVAMPLAIALQALTGSELGWWALPLPVLFLLPPTLASPAANSLSPTAAC
jgi:hypothetical protein